MNEASQTPVCSRCGAPLSSAALKGLCPRCLMALNLAAPTEIPGENGPHGTKVTKLPLTPEEIAKHFPQFQILECLGRGGMGVVYKARQPKLNRIVALKILAPEKVAESRFAERFAREAQALARLNHPHIVTVYDFGEADGLFYLTMEFVDGVSLRQLLQARKIAPEEALAIVPKICEALQFAHDEGVVHRDIKPENVLLDKRGRVKIADFGIAKIVSGTPFAPSEVERVTAKPGEGILTQDQVLGTPHYMAPEQVEHPQRVDHRADIYSLGVVFYEMLTGELPLGRFAPPSKKVQVDVRLDEVVLHALEKEPELRYQQASQVKTDVETIAGSPPAESIETTSKPSAQAIPQTQSAHGKSADSSLGYAVVWGMALLECGLITSGLFLDNIILLLLAAASSGIWGIISAISTARSLEKRGIPVNYLLLGPLIFRYLPQYRALTLKETGKAGPLFYSYIVAMNLALVAALLAWVADHRTNTAKQLPAAETGAADSRNGKSKPESGESIWGQVIEKEVTGMIDLDTGTLVDWPLPEQAEEAALARCA